MADIHERSHRQYPHDMGYAATWEQGYRTALADLWAKVEGMRDEAKADPVGSAVWRTTAYESVLALIEEAQND